jgi:small-conductance mechanosensitive channel
MKRYTAFPHARPDIRSGLRNMEQLSRGSSARNRSFNTSTHFIMTSMSGTTKATLIALSIITVAATVLLWLALYYRERKRINANNLRYQLSKCDEERCMYTQHHSAALD